MRLMTGLLTVVVLGCIGCEPRDTPCFSPDGNDIAFLVDPAPGREVEHREFREVGIVRLADGKVRKFTLPDKWSAVGLVWVGPRLIVDARRPLDVIKVQGQTHEGSYLVLDQATGKFAEAPFKLHILYNPFAGRFGGKPCIYAQDMTEDPADQKTRAYRPDNLSVMGELPFAAQSAGRGWFIRVAHGTVTRPIIEGEHTKWILESLPEDRRTVTGEEMTGVEVFSPEGAKACTIKRDEIAKACSRAARSPLIARVSEDGGRLLLGFDTQTIFRRYPTEYTFGVFDAKTGAMLWRGNSNALMGFPVAAADGVYVLEAKERKRYLGERTPAAMMEGPDATSQPTSELVLARHTGKGREVVIEIRLDDGEKASRYSASPDEKTIVVLVDAAEPRLLLIPVKEKIDAKDLRSVRLTGR